MSDPYVGEIRLLPYSFTPLDWAVCNGQLLTVQQYQALNALIGSTFGTTQQGVNFRVPNLCDRVVIGAGNGPGLSPRIQGTPVGEATVTLPFSEMAAHQHSFNLMYNSSSTTFLDAPVANGYFAGTSDGSVAAGPASTTLNANAVGVAGGSGNPATTQAHANVQPVLSIPYCIALLGLWPDFVD